MSIEEKIYQSLLKEIMDSSNWMDSEHYEEMLLDKVKWFKNWYDIDDPITTNDEELKDLTKKFNIHVDSVSKFFLDQFLDKYEKHESFEKMVKGYNSDYYVWYSWLKNHNDRFVGFIVKLNNYIPVEISCITWEK